MPSRNCRSSSAFSYLFDRFQGQLLKKHEENLERQAEREKIDEQLLVLRRQFKKSQMDYDLEYKKMLAMREEVDNLALRLFYLNNAKLEVKSDITIIQRAAEKATKELNKVISQSNIQIRSTRLRKRNYIKTWSRIECNALLINFWRTLNS